MASLADAWNLLPDELAERARAAQIVDAGHGFDRFGLHRDGVAAGLLVTRFLYERWFRVRSSGHHHLPPSGPALIVANHSGTLPLDALMIWADLVRHDPSHRVPRAIMDHFVPALPGVSTLFMRAGGIGGSRGNLHALLDEDALVMVFPEGVPGIGKRFSERYHLQGWREGHAELAIRHGAPVVPMAVIGAEEQMPQVGRLSGVHAFGAPYLPIPLTVVPLPVRYHLLYGPPIPIHEDYSPEDADDPAIVAAAAIRVRTAVEALIARGLRERTGVFQ